MAKKMIEKGVKLDKVAPKNVVAAKVNGNLVDLNYTTKEKTEVEFIDPDSDEGLEILRHSTAHVLADAVVRLFPKAKPTIGPVVDEGFYYDFDFRPFTPKDLKQIQREMRKIIKKKQKFERMELTASEAKNMFKDNKYKLEMIDEFGENLSAYKHGDFVDLCRGPHIPNTGLIKGVKLTKLAGAYWRGDIDNTQLQRVYGISFPTKDELKKHFKLLQEAEKRDHRKLGKKLKLFSIHQEGPGLIFWLPKGMLLKNSLLDFWKEMHRKADYKLIETPHILSRSLWETSGHWTNYKDKMYTLKIDDKDFAIKPMNCPGGILVYKEDIHSYKEFPLRVGELGFVHRHEQSGEVSGLLRVRGFLQDDAHIYMTPDMLEDEIINVVRLCLELYEPFGFEYDIELSTMPEKHIGTKEQWEKSTKAIEKALKKLDMRFKVSEGEGAFYGPKIDFHLKDAIGRTWQCGTIQVDMSLPEKFDLTYEGKDGHRHRPVMIHRALYGSIERFIGILIEHYAGKFPMWLSPEQVRVISITDDQAEFAQKIVKKYKDAGIRITLDSRSESVGKKIREAQLDYVNYMFIVGGREVENNTVNVRTRDNEVLGEVKPDKFLKRMISEIEERK
ncbi:MAG: Threonine--tRNA ligase catalytic subunit [Candidatus Woesearchaeota archaeon]|nr:Threonine--tRNA ligase catalytic subunit [Candidatus Woesearchaeota archaeon]